MLTTSAGPEGIFPAGAIIQTSEEKAEAMVRGGFARYMDKKEPEKATIEPTERAVLPRPQGRKPKGGS